MSKRKKSGCIFCAIAKEEDEKTEVLFKDEELMVFRDIRPAAPHHYLVCPLKHIRDAKSLDRRHLLLVQRMIDIGKQVLEEKGGDYSQGRLGFHWPPFHLISHLHLHVISPVSEMGMISKGIFMPNSWWFVTPEWLIDRLEKMPENNESGPASKRPDKTKDEPVDKVLDEKKEESDTTPSSL